MCFAHFFPLFSDKNKSTAEGTESVRNLLFQRIHSNRHTYYNRPLVAYTVTFTLGL